MQDGRIFYTQMCEVIHDSGNYIHIKSGSQIYFRHFYNAVPDFAKNADLVTGLEWEDPMQVNRLSVSEERRLSVLITKISVIVNMKKLVLRPFFQDYELVSEYL